MTTAATPLTRRPTLAILVAISMGGTLAMNMILPSLPALEKSFSADKATVQLTLSLFLVGIALAQLVYGPISDRYGRRPMVLGGTLILIAGTVVCLLATTIEVMIVGRIIQAVGGCAGMVMGRAMVRDMFDADRAAAAIAYLTMAAVVAPTLAPLIGGYLEEWFNWSAGFVFVLAMSGMILVYALVASHETLPPEKRHDVEFARLFRSFGVLLKNPLFDGYALQLSFNTAAYFAFLGNSPFIIRDLMGHSPAELGMFFAVVSVLYIIGNFGTARLARKFGAPRMIQTGTMIAMFGSLAMLAAALLTEFTVVEFIVTMSIIALGNGFCISSGTAEAVGADPQRIGAAAGLAGSMQMGFGAVSSTVASALLAYYVDSPIPLIVVIVVCSFAGLISPPLGRHFARHAERRLH